MNHGISPQICNFDKVAQFEQFQSQKHTFRAIYMIPFINVHNLALKNLKPRGSVNEVIPINSLVQTNK